MLKASCTGAIRVLALDRPEKRNALSTALLDEIAAAIRSADAQLETRVIVLAGSAEYFCSGADLDEMLAIKDAGAARDHLLHFRRATETIESSRVPAIAAINGACMTGGLELALACDLRVADETARFTMTSSRIGGLAGAGGTQRLPRLIGASRAKQLMMLADPIDAEVAHAIGLVNFLCPPGQALRRATEVAEELARRAPMSIALLKRAINEGMQLPMEAALDLELDLASEIFTSSDRDEGIAAMRERREPKFEGR
jgi:enoyl-CoA hydratase/carnithine racemase